MKKTKINFTARKGVALFAVLFVILYAIIYIVPKVTDIFTQTYTAEYGILEVKEEARCVFVRNENVYKASAGGKVERKAESGALVRKGTDIAAIGSDTVTNAQRGIVSYCYDGYESKITPDGISNLKSTFISEYRDAKASVKDAASGSVQSGDVIFKIIDENWYLVYWTDEEESSGISQGSTVQVQPDENTEIQMTVESITKQGKEVQIVLSCNRTYKDFDRYRIKDCVIVASRNSGIILETDSISEKDGVKGVYVVDKFGNENFTPVNILSSQDGKTVVEKNFFYDSKGNRVESVSSYDEILKAGK